MMVLLSYFLRTWSGFLPNLILKLENTSEASDYASVNDSLSIADSICKKFYCEPITTCYYLNRDPIVDAGVAGDRIREAGSTRGSPAEDSPTLKLVRVF